MHCGQPSTASPKTGEDLLLYKFSSQLSNIEIGELIRSESAIKSLDLRTSASLRSDLNPKAGVQMVSPEGLSESEVWGGVTVRGEMYATMAIILALAKRGTSFCHNN